MHGKKSHQMLKSMLEGAALGGVLSAALIFGAWANAAGAGAADAIPAEYVDLCEQAGEEYGICPEILEAVMLEESGGDPDAVGDLGEAGLMQVYPKYHMDRMDRLGARSLFDPEDNILVAADYLSELLMEHGDMAAALMAYNGTPDAEGRARSWELTVYAERVLERARQLERAHGK